MRGELGVDKHFHRRVCSGREATSLPILFGEGACVVVVVAELSGLSELSELSELEISDGGPTTRERICSNHELLISRASELQGSGCLGVPRCSGDPQGVAAHTRCAWASIDRSACATI